MNLNCFFFERLGRTSKVGLPQSLFFVINSPPDTFTHYAIYSGFEELDDGTDDTIDAEAKQRFLDVSQTVQKPDLIMVTAESGQVSLLDNVNLQSSTP